MTAVCKRTLRALTGSYLSRPDVQAWLAAADLYEEAGEGETARLWRRRATYYPPLVIAWRESVPPLDPTRIRRYSWAECGSWRVRFVRFQEIIYAYVYDPDGVSQTQRHFTPEVTGGRLATERYATRKLLELIDRFGVSWDAPTISTRRQHS